ncbi:MAG: PhzF family phenazine biosynthesis isomerase [Gammaproteobacteria bacterium]|jgi:trans-2,3-dihydro-3-hydroxyanthranilate isomerase|nr:PhzF family phenazine biosynthesis isomerase [Gammaproteobacteria bacterium]
MRYRYYICDVFTETLFGGNPLAVLPDARGLGDEQMQRIAREFNFSESTFMFPPEDGGDRRVRIFTPKVEVPFAGHPNIGTAFVLALTGELDGRDEVVFEEAAGRVPVTISRDGGRIRCELAAPETLTLSEPASAELIAAALSLEPEDIVTETHLPQAASVGLPFVMAELPDTDTLARARINAEMFDVLADEGLPPDIHMYVLGDDEYDVRARMFAPLDGVPEDPATGSANCALAALLAHYAPEESGDYGWRILQGAEMGRPSVLEARAEKRDGRMTGAWIGGDSVTFAEGWLELG